MKYRFAVTTSNNEKIDLHFGHADDFAIYEVDDSRVPVFIERRVIDRPQEQSDGPDPVTGCKGHNPEHLRRVKELTFDCQFILTEHIGPQAHKGLMLLGVDVLESPLSLNESLIRCYDYCKKQKRREG